MDELELDNVSQQGNKTNRSESVGSVFVEGSDKCVIDNMKKSESSVHEDTQVLRQPSNNTVSSDNNPLVTSTSQNFSSHTVTPVQSKSFDEVKSMDVPATTESYSTNVHSDTPVCYLVYEEVANGSFYLQWKPNTNDNVSSAVLLFTPTKTVPKFKITTDGGRSLFGTKVVPDKNNFYSCLCQFLKLAKDYKSKFQILDLWNTLLPYKSDLYLHYDDNKVEKVESKAVSLDGVNHVAVVGRSTTFSSKMSKEQFSGNTRNSGYSLAI